MASKSSLNPNAQPYIPLCLGFSEFNYKEDDKVAGITSVVSEAEDRCADDGVGTTNLEEEFQSVENFLSDAYPNVSSETLADLFWMNNGDLGDTMAMLDQVEGNTFDNHAGTSYSTETLNTKDSEVINKETSTLPNPTSLVASDLEHGKS